MSDQLPTSRRSRVPHLLAAVLVAAVLLVPSLARADTVYLKNGRTIQAAKVTVTEDKVILEQAGNRVEIPLALVERVERDAAESTVLEPVERPVRPEPTAPTPPTEGDADADAEADAEGEAEAEVDPRTTRAYWQEIVQQNRDARQQLESTLEGLKREERAFLFSHRSTADTKQQIADVERRIAALAEELEELRREARRLQVPPGWLRIGG